MLGSVIVRTTLACCLLVACAVDSGEDIGEEPEALTIAAAVACDVTVSTVAGLITAVNGPAGTPTNHRVICIAAGTYDITGKGSLRPANYVDLIGAPVTKSGYAFTKLPTKITTTGTDIIIRAGDDNGLSVGNRIENLWLNGSRARLSSDNPLQLDQQSGMCIKRLHDVYVKNVRISYCEQNGLDGITGVVEDSEIHHSGDEGIEGGGKYANSAASKSFGGALRYTRTWIHDVQRHGLWWDVNGGPGIIVENCLLENIGIYSLVAEISEQVIFRNNTIRNNGYAAIEIKGTKNVQISGNTFTSGGNAVAIKFWTDPRPLCPTDYPKCAYRVTGIKVFGNSFAGKNIVIDPSANDGTFRAISWGGSASGKDVEIYNNTGLGVVKAL